MARSVKLRELRGGERKILRAKLRDLSLAARIHQRYRVIEEVRRGRSIMEAAERAGCHFTIAYDWLHRFNRSGFVEDLHWADKNSGVRPKNGHDMGTDDSGSAPCREPRSPKPSSLSAEIWWAGSESNTRHKDFQSFALPTELPAHRDSGRIRKRCVQQRIIRILPYGPLQ